MPVNLNPPVAEQLLPVAGVTLGCAHAGIRRGNASDVLLMQFCEGATAAGVFTRNRFCAAPVTVCREHLTNTGGQIRAILINAGNANAGTGVSGLSDARASCAAVAEQIGCDAQDVLPMSTGVILEPLPMDRLLGSIPGVAASAEANNWLSAAAAIMTTDTLPKAVSVTGDADGDSFTMTGIAKGAGMIRPDMGTMLSIVTTDAAIDQQLLQQWLLEAADQSFNRITVDGDTSTNDSLVVVATAAGATVVSDADSPAAHAVRQALFDVTRQLAQMIIRDGEGATKFISIQIEQARSQAEACAIAYSIAHSPLVKTAFFASDANLGRLLCAIGYADVPDLNVGEIELYLGDVLVAANGGRHPQYQEADGERIMSQDEITITVRLKRGDQSTTVWTCDLSHDYVTINAEYRT